MLDLRPLVGTHGTEDVRETVAVHIRRGAAVAVVMGESTHVDLGEGSVAVVPVQPGLTLMATQEEVGQAVFVVVEDHGPAAVGRLGDPGLRGHVAHAKRCGGVGAYEERLASACPRGEA